MADKASRGLVIYGDGFAPLIAPSHSHLHSFASLACSGFLSLRESPGPTENEHDREVREFAQLVDAYDYYTSLNGEHGERDGDPELKKKSPNLTIPERFMGLRGAIFAASPSIRSFARDIGFSVLQIDELIKLSDTDKDHPKKVHGDLSVTSELLTPLGFLDGIFLEKSEFDLVIFHIKAGEIVKVLKDKMVIKTDADWLNNFVGEIMQITHPQSEIASRLLFSLVLSYGTVSDKDCTSSPVSLTPRKMNSDLSLLRPHQSYTMKGGKLHNDIRHHYPMLIAQWQESVTRRDMAKEFSCKEIEEHGGNLAILADRFLHEVAFKLWKAPKYGA